MKIWSAEEEEEDSRQRPYNKKDNFQQMYQNWKLRLTQPI